MSKYKDALNKAILIRFGVFPEPSWYGGMVEIEWKRIFLDSIELLEEKLRKRLAAGQQSVDSVSVLELEKLADLLLEDGLKILSTSNKLLGDGGEEYQEWLRE